MGREGEVRSHRGEATRITSAPAMTGLILNKKENLP